MTDRCRFVRAGAEDLGEVADGAVDAVTTRSVLIYVADKASAFYEFQRVLAPGGRISLFEPINRYFLDAGNRHRPIYESGPIADLVERVSAVFMQVNPMDGPMMNFDERDLLDLAERARFMPLNLRLELDVRRPPPRDWEFYVRSSPNPLAPTLEEAMREAALTPSEIERYQAHVRPLVEGGTGTIGGPTRMCRRSSPLHEGGDHFGEHRDRFRRTRPGSRRSPWTRSSAPAARSSRPPIATWVASSHRCHPACRWRGMCRDRPRLAARGACTRADRARARTSTITTACAVLLSRRQRQDT